jgi:transposase
MHADLVKLPGRGIYDNMKTAVDKVGIGKKRDVNARFTAMTSHYVFDPEFCNPAAGWEKGQVEKNVRDARHRMWQLMPAFPDLDALNAWLEERCKLLWAETAHGTLPAVTLLKLTDVAALPWHEQPERVFA